MVLGLANAANTVSEPETWMVCLLGVTVVFAGLICIIAIVALMNALTTIKVAKSVAPKESAAPAAVAPAAPAANSAATPVAAPIENRGEIVAAVCAAVAEELGTDVSAIRVVSFKKIN
jgi:Na+-transporting methylmalonyl-CoA/oxaloacetate decarboxylase gamma subunit